MEFFLNKPIYRHILKLLEEKADAIVLSASGSFAHFEDGAEADAKSVIAHIEPVQDLHGYDSPWPAGGGKNLLSLPNTTFTQYREAEIDEIVAGTYIYSGVITSNDTDGTDCSIIFLDENKNTLVTKSLSRSVAGARVSTSAFTVSAPIKYVRLYASSSYPYGAGDTANFNDNMIEAGTSPTSYAPYSNICPISGFTGMDVVRTGKNLLAMPFEYYTATASKDNCFHLLSGTYTFSFDSTTETSWRFVLRLYDADGNEIISGTPVGENTPYRASVHGFTNGTDITYKSFSFTLKSDAYVRVLFWGGSTSASSTFTNVQLELGSTATDYEPYQGETYPITFPTEAGTVYGGYVDVTRGKLVVDRANIASYSRQAIPSAWISDRDAYEPGRMPTTGSQVVYELAAPVIYDVTPQQIALLLGVNNVWNNCNGNTNVTYRADTKLYIDNRG